MTKEEKIQIAKKLYEELGIQTENLISTRIDKINADICIPSESQRGTGGIIIGDDGSYLVCGSIKPVESYVEDYKNGERTTMNSNESLVESKVQEFANEETKKAYEEYKREMEEYNRKVENGETPDIKLFDLLDKYRDTFYDEDLEKKLKQIEEEWKNRPKDDTLDKMISEIDKKIEEIEGKERI